MIEPVATLPPGIPADVDDSGTAGTEHSFTAPPAAGPVAHCAPPEAERIGRQVAAPAGAEAEPRAEQPAGAQASSPRAAEELGLGDRYRYLAGASGRRYLFSRLGLDALEDCRNAVMVVGLGATSAIGSVRRVWIGEIDREGIRRGPALPRALALAAEGDRDAALVHLLAGDAAERRKVLEDLAAGLERAGLETLVA